MTKSTILLVAFPVLLALGIGAIAIGEANQAPVFFILAIILISTSFFALVFGINSRNSTRASTKSITLLILGPVLGILGALAMFAGEADDAPGLVLIGMLVGLAGIVS